MSAGHGGQVLVSSVSAGLLSGVELTDLGEHRLKDLGASERLWQTAGASFPPLSTLERVRHNLPVQRTELFGREVEIAAVRSLVRERRLVTLIGVGGAGKTRLALEVSALA